MKQTASERTAQDRASFLMGLQLLLLVPPLMEELSARGGPDEDDYALLGKISETWSREPSRIDTLIRAGEGPGKGGVNPDTLRQIAEGLAVMAFCPGGVTFLGQHWERDIQAAEQSTSAAGASS